MLDIFLDKYIYINSKMSMQNQNKYLVRQDANNSIKDRRSTGKFSFSIFLLERWKKLKSSQENDIRSREYI